MIIKLIKYIFNIIFFTKNNSIENNTIENNIKYDNYKIICNNCKIEKNKRYIFTNNEDNKLYCITCLKDKYFFKRYNLCQYCYNDIYNTNDFMILMYNKDNDTINICNRCFEYEYIEDNFIEK